MGMQGIHRYEFRKYGMKMLGTNWLRVYLEKFVDYVISKFDKNDNKGSK